MRRGLVATAGNQQIARRLEEVAELLAEQGANSFRVDAYRGGAETVRRHREPVASLLEREGIAGLLALPGIGESLARSTRDLTLTGRLLYSNTARAHRLGKTRDWVVLCYDGDDGERQCTVLTSERGPLRGRHIVRGRKAECLALPGAPP